jgi:glutaconate CoA-transferase subunit B
VPDVDFISAPGARAPNVYRPGGPVALITNRCLFSFANGRFRLESVHPGHTSAEVRENTGFDYDTAKEIGETPPPSPATLKLLREAVAPQLAEVYPQFAAQVFGVKADAAAG